jgi:hypothetical protein
MEAGRQELPRDSGIDESDLDQYNLHMGLAVPKTIVGVHGRKLGITVR